MRSTIFLSYAGEDYDIAQQMCDEINNQLGKYYYSELVENMREGDTTCHVTSKTP